MDAEFGGGSRAERNRAGAGAGFAAIAKALAPSGLPAWLF